MHKGLLTLGALLVLPMMLAGCESLKQATANGTLTTSGKPAACLSIGHISPNRGKPGGPTIEDIAATLDRDHPVDRIRNLVGDTSGTLKQVDQNNAARDALCE